MTSLRRTLARAALAARAEWAEATFWGRRSGSGGSLGAERSCASSSASSQAGILLPNAYFGLGIGNLSTVLTEQSYRSATLARLRHGGMVIFPYLDNSKKGIV
jgi:hypothetical protein